MNERISEIWDQAAKASALLRLGENSWETQKAFIEKFALLIVKECIEKSLEERIDPDLIEQEQDIEDRCYLRGSNSGIIDAVCAIKQHFEVEE